MIELDDNAKEMLEFQTKLYDIFNTESGRSVLKKMKETHVEGSAMNEDSHVTAYNLGRKEFVQGLIKDAETNPEEL